MIGPTITYKKSTESFTNNLTFQIKLQDELSTPSGYALSLYKSGAIQQPSVWTDILTITSSFTVNYTPSQTGTYIIWAKDSLGNISSMFLDCTNYDIDLPTISIKPLEDVVPYNATINFSEATSYLVEYSITTTNASPSQWKSISGNKTAVAVDWLIKENGTYYIWVKDAAGNTACLTYDAILKNEIYMIVIPKTITLDGGTGIGTYNVEVAGKFNSSKEVKVTAAPNFILSDLSSSSNKKPSIKARTEQTKDTWDITDLSTVANGKVSARDLSAGIWSGSLTFQISISDRSSP